MGAIIKRYNCWGVPAAIWKDEVQGMYVCGFYDVDKEQYISGGDIEMVMLDGFEIGDSDAALKLVTKYSRRVKRSRCTEKEKFYLSPKDLHGLEKEIEENRKEWNEVIQKLKECK